MIVSNIGFWDIPIFDSVTNNGILYIPTLDWLHPHWDVKLSNVGENISNTGYMHNPTSDNSFPTLDHRSVPLWMNCFPHTGLIHFPIRQSPSMLDCYIKLFNIWTALTSNGNSKIHCWKLSKDRIEIITKWKRSNCKPQTSVISSLKYIENFSQRSK